MTDELQQALVEFLKLMLDSIKDGAAFAKHEIPMVIQEKLYFDLTWDLVIVVACVVLYLVAHSKYPVFKAAYKAASKGGSNDAVDGWGLFVFLTILVRIVMTVVSLIYLHDVIQIIVAPRLYIIEWLAGLASGKS